MNIIKRALSKRLTKTFITAFVVSSSSCAWASGFLYPVQNMTNMGTAFAGTASLASDASSNFYNSAGLTRLCNPQLVAGAAYSFPRTKLDVAGATPTIIVLPPFGLSPIGPGTERPKNQALLPFFHYAHPLDECWSIGLSVTPTFGSRANYDEGSLVRYMATRSQLGVVDTAPSIAYRLTDQFSLGAGPNFIFAKADLNTALGAGIRPADGFTKNSVKRTGWGFHAGGLYEWDECTRLGLNYRSGYKIRFKGDSWFQQAAGAAVTKQGVRGDVHFPEVVTLSGYHDLNDRFAVMADLRWTRWERFKQLVLRLDNGGTLATNYNWKNTWLGAIGGTYKPHCDWQVKLGVSYENTPTKDATRTVNILDQKQTALMMGLNYQFSRCVGLDLSYAHVLFKTMNVNQLAPISGGVLPQTVQTVQGSARYQMRVVGLQLTWDII